MTVKGVAKLVACGLKNDMRNFANFHASSRKSGNLHFDPILLSKANKNLNEKVQKSYVSWHGRMMQSLKKNWLLVQKMTWGIWWILMRAVGSLKIFTLMCYFCRKYTMLEQKKVKGSYVSYTEEWSKRLRKTNFLFWKMAWGIWRILTRAVEGLKICTLMGYFCQKM